MEQINHLLNEHKLRKTRNRTTILEQFLKYSYALSHADLERLLNPSLDRVTIYRTLASFEKHGLIHRVYDDSEVSKYSLCSSKCSYHTHDDQHVHFSCTHCGNTFCIDVSIPSIRLPEGYSIESLSFLAQGTCPDCQ